MWVNQELYRETGSRDFGRKEDGSRGHDGVSAGKVQGWQWRHPEETPRGSHGESGVLGFGFSTYTCKVSADHGPQSLLWEKMGINRNRGWQSCGREYVCIGSPEGLERDGVKKLLREGLQ